MAPPETVTETVSWSTVGVGVVAAVDLPSTESGSVWVNVVPVICYSALGDMTEQTSTAPAEAVAPPASAGGVDTEGSTPPVVVLVVDGPPPPAASEPLLPHPPTTQSNPLRSH